MKDLRDVVIYAHPTLILEQSIISLTRNAFRYTSYNLSINYQDLVISLSWITEGGLCR